MKHWNGRGPLWQTLSWMKGAFFAAALCAFAYCAFVMIQTRAFQKREGRELDRLVALRRAARAPDISKAVLLKRRPPAAAADPMPLSRGVDYASPAKQPRPAAPGDLIGRIEILRLGISTMVIEGTGDATLRRAAGHIAGTALPGGVGNVGIAGHRDTFFRPLRNVRRNDIITITTPIGEYRYRVLSTRIVSPTNVEVLNPSATQILTLVTCYPFYYVGPAPGRFIVRAERII